MNPTLSQVTIANYKSIFGPQTIRFDATGAKTFALYGQNASGKSNTLKAIRTIAEIIVHSSDAGYQLPYSRFHYAGSDIEKPTIFEIEVTSEQYTMRYLFAYNSTRIIFEELKIKSQRTNKYKTLFFRDAQNNLNPSSVNYNFNKQILRRTLPKTLLLTKAYEDNNPYAKFIFKTIEKIMFVSLDSKQIERKAFYILSSNSDIKEKVSNWLSKSEPSIKGLRTTSVDIYNQTFEKPILDSSLSSSYVDVKILRKYGDIKFLENICNESSGTRIMIAVLTMILYSIDNDIMLCIDEFGNYLHPRIASEILNYYESLSPTKQLLITTHLLGLYDHIGRAERIIARKDKNTGETLLEQRKHTLNQRIIKKERKEAEEYFNTFSNKKIHTQSKDKAFIYNLLGGQ